MAYPLVVALVVFPMASSVSVASLTSGGRSAISARPDALSETGPNESSVITMPAMERSPTEAAAVP